MRRRIFLLGIPGMAGCTSSRRPRLNVYNWSNYMAPATIRGFEAECGVRVRYGIYESNEEMLAKVMTGNSGWDVVFPTHNRIEPLRQYGMLAPLRLDWLPNARHLEARFRAPAWDPALAWSVPYMWGATGIVYNRKVTPPPAAWADLWSARLKGRMTMLDDPEEVLGACLKKLGLSVNATGADSLGRAQHEAIVQKPLLRAYLNAEVRDQLVAGDVLAAQLWSTTAQQAMDAAPELAFVYPAEGFPVYADCAAVLRESRRGELAHRFIDYLLRPEVSAEIVAATRTATANGTARSMLPAESRDNPALYPSPEILARAEWTAAMPAAAQRLRDRLWTEIKSA